MSRKPECLSRIMLALKQHFEFSLETPVEKVTLKGFGFFKLMLVGRESPLITWDSLVLPLITEARRKNEGAP